DIFLIASCIAACAVSALSIKNSLTVQPTLAEHAYSIPETPLLSLFYAVLFIWIAVIFLRQTIRCADRPVDIESPARGKHQDIFTAAIISWIRISRSTSLKIIFPESYLSRTAGSCAAAALFLFIIQNSFAFTADLPPYAAAAADTLLCVASLFFYTRILFAWINASHDPVSIVFSAAALSAVLTVITVSIAAALSFAAYNYNYDSVKLKNIELIKPVIAAGENIFSVDNDIGFIAGSPSDRGYFSPDYTPDYTSPAFSFDDIDAMLNKRRNDAIQNASERLTLKFTALKPAEIDRLAKMKIESAEVKPHARFFVAAEGRGFYQYAFIHDDTLRLIGFDYIIWRRKMHTLSLVMIMICAVLTPAAAFISARFYDAHINRPMRRLTDAVTRINDSGGSRLVHSEREDEIGILSRSFNAMLGSLREAKKNEKDARQSAAEMKAETERLRRKLNKGGKDS
ncbi:MAG: HAMP domain-containing protein, partial [Spirochaetota bacterium]